MTSSSFLCGSGMWILDCGWREGVGGEDFGDRVAESGLGAVGSALKSEESSEFCFANGHFHERRLS